MYCKKNCMKVIIPYIRLLLVLWVQYSCGQSIELNQTNTKASGAFSITDISKDFKSQHWYLSQAEVWRAKATENKKDATAWFNYYKAERYSNYTATSKEISLDEQKKLDAILDKMGESVENSFEYNYLMYVNGKNNPVLFSYLEKAYKSKPDNAETYDDFIGYYEMTGDKSKEKEFCSKLAQSKTIEDELYSYNHNVLLSLDKNAIIFTNGNDDTYPLFVLQSASRTDVSILNIDLLQNATYASAQFKNHGLSGDSACLLVSEPAKFYEYITRKNPDKPIYFALTIPKNNLEPISSNLYLTGLAYKYSKSGFDNLTVLKNNWETVFNISYLFDNETRYSSLKYNSAVNKMNMNYIMPMAVLFREYISKGEILKAENIKKQALIIAKRMSKEKITELYFK